MANTPSLIGPPLVLVVALSGCDAVRGVPTVELPSEPPVESEQAQSAPLRVGAYVSLSGSGSSRALRIKEGISLAIDEINEGGGVAGRPIEVLYADDRSDPSMIVNRVAELIFLQKVLGLLGDLSVRSMAGSALAEKNQVPLIAAAPPQGDGDREGSFVFHACAGAKAQGRLAAAFVVETMGKKRVGLLYPPDAPYSMGLASAFRDEAKRLGVEAVIERTFALDEASSAIPLLEVMDDRPDVIYAPIEPSLMARIARNASLAGIPGEMFVGSDAWGAEDFLRDSGGALAGALFADHWAPDAPWPASRSFVAHYKERFQRDPTTPAALAYDAARMLAAAIERAAMASPSPSRDAVREALEETSGIAGVCGARGAPRLRDKEREADRPMVMRRIEPGKAIYYTALDPSAQD